MVLYAFLRLKSPMLNQIKEDGARSNRKRDKEQVTRPNAEVVDWFLAIDLLHV